MRYYRVAIQSINSSSLTWKSAPLTSLETLFRFFQFYTAIPQGRFRVFTASSREELKDMLARENEGLAIHSIPGTQFLRERGISSGESGQEDATTSPGNTSIDTLVPRDQSRVPDPALIVSIQEKKRFELEVGSGGDHDQPYTFALPTLTSQWLAWMRLLVRVRQGNL